jgi:hypothetical protein
MERVAARLDDAAPFTPSIMTMIHASSSGRRRASSAWR